MASFKDRRISDLPLALSLEEGSAFLIVNGIDGRPYNQRINTKVLFNNIPVPLIVGSELSGRDVTFHASNNPKHNFSFSQETGDVVLGHDALVSNNLIVNGSLRVAGTTIINNVDFDRISVNEEFISTVRPAPCLRPTHRQSRTAYLPWVPCTFSDPLF